MMRAAGLRNGWAAALFAWALAPMPAMSQDQLDAIFWALDTDQDGMLFQYELLAIGQDRFFTADSNGDGYVGVSELAAYWRKTPEAGLSPENAAVYLSAMDHNKDGKLDMTEFMRPQEQVAMISPMERDGFPGISRQEFRAWLLR